MKVEGQDSSFWAPYRRRRRQFVLIAIACVPGILGLGYLLSRVLDPGLSMAVVAVPWLIAFFVSYLRMCGCRCPRCGRPFFFVFWSGQPFALNCVHCGCPKWSED